MVKKKFQLQTLIFESLSPVINLAYIQKNCWNLADPSITFPGVCRLRTRAPGSALEAPLPPHPPSQPSSQGPRPPLATTLAPLDLHGQMLRSIHMGQQLIRENMHRLSLHLQMDPPLITPEAYRQQVAWPGDQPSTNMGGRAFWSCYWGSCSWWRPHCWLPVMSADERLPLTDTMLYIDR